MDVRKKILVWYFRVGAENGTERTRLSELRELGFELEFINIVTSDLPLKGPEEFLHGYGAIVILGSSELFFDGGRPEHDAMTILAEEVAGKLQPHIRHIIQHDIPTFGLCFGHQLIAHTLGSKIFRDSTTGKVGTHEIELTRHALSDPLLEGVPPTFAVQYGHKDVVSTIPRSGTLLAYGRNCHVAMLRYGDNVYSAQFHPELDRKSLLAILKEYKNYSTDPDAHHKVLETPFGKKILENFGQKVLSMP